MKKLTIIIFFLTVYLTGTYSQTHFVKNWANNGVDHMNFYATPASVNGVQLSAGDEVAIFDGTACVGVTLLTGALNQGDYLSIIASKDDETTGTKDGYTSENVYSVKVWDASEGQEISNLSVETIGDQVFVVGGSATVKLAIDDNPPPPSSSVPVSTPGKLAFLLLLTAIMGVVILRKRKLNLQ